jgi:hypothetical protein
MRPEKPFGHKHKYDLEELIEKVNLKKSSIPK